MAKKKNSEEQIIKEATNIIMRTIHNAAGRIAEKYERMLMQEVMAQIQAQMEVNKEVNEFTGYYLNDKLNDLSK